MHGKMDWVNGEKRNDRQEGNVGRSKAFPGSGSQGVCGQRVCRLVNPRDQQVSEYAGEFLLCPFQEQTGSIR